MKGFEEGEEYRDLNDNATFTVEKIVKTEDSIYVRYECLTLYLKEKDGTVQFGLGMFESELQSQVLIKITK